MPKDTIPKLTHEEADRRIMEAMKPKKQGGELLSKFREIAKRRKAGAETPAITETE